MLGRDSLKKLLAQAAGFVGLSGIGWLLDFCVFAILGNVSPNVTANNFLSSWVGVTFVFLFATRKVFQNNSRISLKWKYAIYLLYQLLLIALVSRLLGFVNGLLLDYVPFSLIRQFSGIISKILVTPITMLLNFIVMKNLIEKL